MAQPKFPPFRLLRAVLGTFDLVRPAVLRCRLLIREHARKFEYIVAEATVWTRREASPM